MDSSNQTLCETLSETLKRVRDRFRRPAVVVPAELFITTSLAQGGLVAVSDAAQVLGLSYSTLRDLVHEDERLTLFCFPFGRFLSVREVNEFRALERPAGRPRKNASGQGTNHN